MKPLRSKLRFIHFPCRGGTGGEHCTPLGTQFLIKESILCYKVPGIYEENVGRVEEGWHNI